MLGSTLEELKRKDISCLTTCRGLPLGLAIDLDAQAFLTASGITDSTITSAINTLITTMKSDGIWTKMKAIYPMVGGTASTHKWNLKDPRDLDAAFRLTFYGGCTHNSNGVTFNATNGYADTYVNDQNNLEINNKHISMYQRNILSDPSGTSMGISNTNRFYLLFAANNYSTLGMGQSPFLSVAPQRGMFIMSKIMNGAFKYFQNNLTPVSKTGTNASENLKYFIGANCSSGGLPVDYTSANLAFVSLGGGLSDTEAHNFYTAIQTFQTTLGRQV